MNILIYFLYILNVIKDQIILNKRSSNVTRKMFVHNNNIRYIINIIII